MLIVDEIRDVAKRVGVTVYGNTIPEILASFRKGLDERDADKAASALSEPNISTKRSKHESVKK